MADRAALRARARALVGSGVALPPDISAYLAELVARDEPAGDRLAERDRILREAGHWIGGSLSHRAARILELDALEDRRCSARPWRLMATEPRDLVRAARSFGPIPRRRRLLRILAEGFAVSTEPCALSSVESAQGPRGRFPP